jgi:hypothetical protein
MSENKDINWEEARALGGVLQTLYRYGGAD